MKTRIIVALIFVPLLIVVIFFCPPFATAIMTAFISTVAAYEMVRAVKAEKNVRICLYAVISAAAIQAGAMFGLGSLIFRITIYVLTALAFLEAVLTYGTEKAMTFSQIMGVIFGGSVIPFFLSSLITIRTHTNGQFYIAVPFIAAFMTDTGAYFIGIFFGKQKVTPQLSPHKTVEGFIGGAVVGLAAMLIYGAVLSLMTDFNVSFWSFASYGLAGGLVSEFGDLAFSFIKRETGIKDYGNILPGHGGILDRFDSMIFVAPVIMMMIYLFPAL